jgi:hypothetical protein
MIKVAVVTALILIEFKEIDKPSSDFIKCKGYDYYMFTNDKNKAKDF